MAAFAAVQVCIVGFAANGPFVDEGLYTVAGIRVLEGKGLSDGYLAWFNGSPFVWPVLAAIGHGLGGFTGTRFMAVVISMVTLVAFAKTAETLFGESAAAWAAAGLAVNGLFMALAHFAVYDVPALAGVAVSMWCVTRSSRGGGRRWLVGGAIAFGFAVIAKYGFLLMLVPVAGLIASTHDRRHLGRALATFLIPAGTIVAGYFVLVVGSLHPTSMAAYLGQTFQRSRGHIALLQIVFAIVPIALAAFGGVLAWRRGQRMLVVTCLLALSLYPAFHLYTANFVSGQKHVVAGFLFAYLLAGLALERLWRVGSRAALALLLLSLTAWGGLQWYWQEHSWSDSRRLADFLVGRMQPGETLIAESPWVYTLFLYPRGLVRSPLDVVDANYAANVPPLDPCRAAWIAGNLDTARLVHDAVARCGHRQVLSSSSRQYYLDTTRLRLGVAGMSVALYRAR